MDPSQMTEEQMLALLQQQQMMQRGGQGPMGGHGSSKSGTLRKLRAILTKYGPPVVLITASYFFRFVMPAVVISLLPGELEDQLRAEQAMPPEAKPAEPTAMDAMFDKDGMQVGPMK